MILPSSMYLLTIGKRFSALSYIAFDLRTILHERTVSAMSIVWMHQVVPPGGSLLNQTNVNFTLVCWATSVANNVMITLGIVGYLLRMRFRIRSILGPLTRENIPYITVSAILIESAFLYTAFMLAFLIPLAMDSSVNCLFFQVIPQVQVSYMIHSAMSHVLMPTLVPCTAHRSDLDRTASRSRAFIRQSQYSTNTSRSSRRVTAL